MNINRAIKIFLIFCVTFIGMQIVCANGAFTNKLLKVDVYQNSTGLINVKLYTSKPYKEPLNVRLKGDPEYVILLPETSSVPNLKPTIKTTFKNIQGIKIKTQPYTDRLKGYTKITLITAHPATVSVKTETLVLKPVVATKKAEKIKLAATKPVAKIPTQIKKPQIEQATQQKPALRPYSKPTVVAVKKAVQKTVTEKPKIVKPISKKIVTAPIVRQKEQKPVTVAQQKTSLAKKAQKKVTQEALPILPVKKEAVNKITAPKSVAPKAATQKAVTEKIQKPTTEKHAVKPEVKSIVEQEVKPEVKPEIQPQVKPEKSSPISSKKTEEKPVATKTPVKNILSNKPLTYGALAGISLILLLLLIRMFKGKKGIPEGKFKKTTLNEPSLEPTFESHFEPQKPQEELPQEEVFPYFASQEKPEEPIKPEPTLAPEPELFIEKEEEEEEFPQEITPEQFDEDFLAELAEEQEAFESHKPETQEYEISEAEEEIPTYEIPEEEFPEQPEVQEYEEDLWPQQQPEIGIEEPEAYTPEPFYEPQEEVSSLSELDEIMSEDNFEQEISVEDLWGEEESTGEAAGEGTEETEEFEPMDELEPKVTETPEMPETSIFETPEIKTSVFEEPVFEAPVFEEPKFEQPGIEEPIWEEISEISEIPEAIEQPEAQPQAIEQGLGQFIKEEKKVEEVKEVEQVEETDEMVKSQFIIDNNKGLYLVDIEDTSALVGQINDEIFVLKKFAEKVDAKLQARLNETKQNSSSYMAKIGNFKALIEVTQNNMKLLIEL